MNCHPQCRRALSRTVDCLSAPAAGIVLHDKFTVVVGQAVRSILYALPVVGELEVDLADGLPDTVLIIRDELHLIFTRAELQDKREVVPLQVVFPGLVRLGG